VNADAVSAVATMARRISGEQPVFVRRGPLFSGGQDHGRALVIVPTYNERPNIRKLIAQVMSQGDRFDVLVVDDNSPDGTGQLADQLAAEDPRVHVLHRPSKAGLGKAYLAGFQWGLARSQYDCFFEMDADFSHDPSHLPAFLEAIQSADLVLGSRYDQGKVTVVNWPITRLMLSYGANIYARWVTGVHLDDATGGYKCFRRSVLEAIPLDHVRSNGYAFQIEMSARAHGKGFRIAQIPIVFTDRTEGQSKMSGNIVSEAIVMCWRLRWWAMTGQLS
jgi:dolichol-phosphate mannosyltransferase